ncbi:MAG: BlaI/MecI/CopY family transcriptional regulator [Lachnospiraceae bacterium]|nr:BlaI/MecI/CopY family transcriptional regulator [Lachnospiraceae bacterium]
MISQSSLPDAELEIMQIVWQFEPPVARSAIEKKLSEQKHLAPSTILTYLTRLCDRGFLRVEQQGRKNLYTPLITRKDYLSGESRRMLDRLFGGSLSELAVSLCDSGIKKEEIDALRTMLEEGSL